MASSNTRFAVHVDVTGNKDLDMQQVVRVQAVTFSSDAKQEEWCQEFLPEVAITKNQSAVHGFTKQGLKKSHAPIFDEALGAQFVEFVGNGRGYSDAPWKIHVLNNELRANGLSPLPKLTYTYTLYKELHPERRRDHKQGQHTIEMISSMYPVGNLKDAYRIAAVQLKMEAERDARVEKAVQRKFETEKRAREERAAQLKVEIEKRAKEEKSDTPSSEAEDMYSPSSSVDFVDQEAAPEVVQDEPTQIEAEDMFLPNPSVDSVGQASAPETILDAPIQMGTDNIFSQSPAVDQASLPMVEKASSEALVTMNLFSPQKRNLGSQSPSFSRVDPFATDAFMTDVSSECENATPTVKL